MCIIETVERERLFCFIDLLKAIGLGARVRWQGDTFYTLKIYRPYLCGLYKRPLLYRVHETDPDKPPVAWPWTPFSLSLNPRLTVLTEVIRVLFQVALKKALKDNKISVELADNEVRRAVKEFPCRLARDLQVFPVKVRYGGDGIMNFQVVRTHPLNPDHPKIPCETSPIRINVTNNAGFKHIADHTHLYIESHFPEKVCFLG